MNIKLITHNIIKLFSIHNSEFQFLTKDSLFLSNLIIFYLSSTGSNLKITRLDQNKINFIRIF
jgi:hypothetical protein